ncbi:MOSC domain-containing protein [Marinobacter sp. SS21]|uniref:MOSC domain-containing protein n=1 Tax=Marinobacter sp. SS21 TaxID=2979460 RepID=UPI00232DEA85|nr:MOSC N-terminal beta barrel domain-containing protein [Marinobacter sp. SS21]MDC0663316.1 MOSC domain-containing protein [Marinobacter sp. SS21]
MRVRSLYIYPVKSLRGIAVQEMALDGFGPADDRRWMIVDRENQFVTQRTHPQLANVGTELIDGQVWIDVPGQARYPLSAGPTERSVRVWRDWVKGRLAEPGPAAAVSAFCGQSVELVYMPESTFRRVDSGWVMDRRRVGFADGFPFLIVNQASLDDLNGRLQVAVDERRFRPNIVIDGPEPWAEDVWRSLDIGKRSFSLPKPCSRCVMTTVDPDRGVKAPDSEPLRTLGRFRRTADGVMFGVNALHDGKPGVIRVGDAVEILEQE